MPHLLQHSVNLCRGIDLARVAVLFRLSYTACAGQDPNLLPPRQKRSNPRLRHRQNTKHGRQGTSARGCADLNRNATFAALQPDEVSADYATDELPSAGEPSPRVETRAALSPQPGPSGQRPRRGRSSSLGRFAGLRVSPLMRSNSRHFATGGDLQKSWGYRQHRYALDRRWNRGFRHPAVSIVLICVGQQRRSRGVIRNNRTPMRQLGVR